MSKNFDTVANRRNRLRHWIDWKCGGSQAEFIEKTGINQGELSALLKDKSFGEKKARKLEADAGMPPNWLDELVLITSNAESAPILGAFTSVPVVGSAQLGDNAHWSELEYPVGHGDGYVTHPTRDRNAYALRCVGDSMKPRIHDGEFVVVEPNHEPIPGDEVMLKTHDGRVMIKTLLYKRDGKVCVESINNDHPSLTFNLADIDKIHYVAATVKRPYWHD